MATVTLTTDADTFVGGPEDNTVNGTAATLNAGDRLTGGSGTDVLALDGSGSFHVDQLAIFTGFENITLNNLTNGAAILYLGGQPLAVTESGSGQEYVYLGSGATTVQSGSAFNQIVSTTASDWNAGNAIDESSSLSGYLYLDTSGQANATYDLTTNALTNILYLYGNGDSLTLKINSADANGVANFSGGGTNEQLVTSDTALDLSHSSVSGFTVASTNTTGTTFTVQDAGTAFQIAGGPGQDTISAPGFAFTADQRVAIFAAASVEKIVDASGTYTPPPPDPAAFTLTTNADTFEGGPEDNTVNGTAATLNAGDRLTGGTGTDVLALYGSGAFHVDQLAIFTGFESITLNNFTNGAASLYLGSQPLAVTESGSGQEVVYVGSGATTVHGGSAFNQILSTTASDWNAGNAIDESSSLSGYLYLDTSGQANAVYDLTTNALTNILYLYGNGDGLTLKINSADANGVANFGGLGAGDQLVTSDAALDLSHSSVTGFTVASTNTAGTTFTVQDAGAAFQIAGGPGQDTISAPGFAFTAGQRASIFGAASIEKIIDSSGTYDRSETFVGSVGNNAIVGQAWMNTVDYSGLSTSGLVAIIQGGGGSVNKGGANGSDTLTNIQIIIDTGAPRSNGDVFYVDANETVTANSSNFNYLIELTAGVNLSYGTNFTGISEFVSNVGTNTVSFANDPNFAYVYGSTGNDTLTLGAGGGYLFGEGGTNTLTGGANATNLFVGGGGSDTMNGGTGTASNFYFVDGNDQVNGAGAFNTAIELVTGVTVQLGSAQYQDVQEFVASSGTNAVTVANADSDFVYLYGGAGNDTLTTGSGGGYLFGEGGTNVLTGGGGTNIFVADNASGIDTMNGGSGSNIYFVDSHSTVHGAGTFNNVVELQQNASLTLGGAQLGTDVQQVVLNGGTNTVDFHTATSAVFLYGAAGNDTLFGGTGNDFLFGGAGTNTFTFAAGWGHDTIMDWTTTGANDQIDLTALAGLGVHAVTDLTQIITGGNDVITSSHTGSNSITLNGVGSALTGLSFRFA